MNHDISADMRPGPQQVGELFQRVVDQIAPLPKGQHPAGDVIERLQSPDPAQVAAALHELNRPHSGSMPESGSPQDGQPNK